VLPEMFRFVQDWRMVIYGISVLAVVVFFPDGLLELKRLFRRKPTPKSPTQALDAATAEVTQ
jgi:hypothetical protein